jgi:hypothetical protein
VSTLVTFAVFEALPDAQEVPSSVARRQLDSALVQGIDTPAGILARVRATGRDGASGFAATLLLASLLGRRWRRWRRSRTASPIDADAAPGGPADDLGETQGGARPPAPGEAQGPTRSRAHEAEADGVPPARVDDDPEAWRRRIAPRPKPAPPPIPLPPQVAAALDRIAAREEAVATGRSAEPPGESPRPAAQGRERAATGRFRRGLDLWIGR